MTTKRPLSPVKPETACHTYGCDRVAAYFTPTGDTSDRLLCVEHGEAFGVESLRLIRGASIPVEHAVILAKRDAREVEAWALEAQRIGRLPECIPCRSKGRLCSHHRAVQQDCEPMLRAALAGRGGVL